MRRLLPADEERGTRIIAKSLDDRIGCAIGIEAMRKLAAWGTSPTRSTSCSPSRRKSACAGRGVRVWQAPDLGIALD
jgi:putative aminopeptidase FrvX